jgi:glycosyltransferase involved in cell wall biosynthesis
MKIAIDVSPLETGHKVRGVGFYLEHLKSSLVKYFPQNEYIFFKSGESLPKGIDLIHFPYFEPFFLALPIYKKYKTIVTVHDLTPIVFPNLFPRGFKGQLKWQMQRYALKQANAIITDSQNSKSDILKYVGFKENKVNVAYLAAGEGFKRFTDNELINKNSELRTKFKLPEKFLLYVGDVTPNKNLPRLLNAIQTTNIPLVLVGKAFVSDFDKTNPWNRDLVRVHKQIEELRVKNKDLVSVLGFLEQDDLVAIYNMATASILPSFYEGFGLPVLEAQACGAPVITTKEASLSEVGGNSVYYVDAFNYEKMAEGIRKVFGDKKLQQELREKGLVNTQRFSWKKTVSETIKVYESV